LTSIMAEYFAGIDIGSTMTKAVIMEEEKIITSVIGPTGPEQRHLANEVMKEALEQAGLQFERVSYIVSTGYGRINVPFADKEITEISCHARGVVNLFPMARTIIDIGGQDSKGISVGRDGRPRDFVMNDKCAAGSGRFLEVIADNLGVDIREMGDMGLQGKNPSQISNLCTVWAEQEVAERLAEGVDLPDLVAGIHRALATRVVRMVERITIEPEVVFTGGVAKNAGMVKVLSEEVGFPLIIPPEPLLTGALGAALIGKDIVKRAKDKGLRPERRREPSATPSSYCLYKSN